MPSLKELQSLLENNEIQITRLIGAEIERTLDDIECVTLLGPRQIGKTTIAKSHFEQNLGAVYRDLEESEAQEEVGTGGKFFERHKQRIIILDEIQECGYLFKNIKAFIDVQRFAKNRDCRFLLFGSASLDVQRRAFSSLAGRVCQLQMFGILPTELIKALAEFLPSTSEDESLETNRKITELLMFRGGMPLSLLAKSDEESAGVRTRFIETYVHSDIQSYNLNVDPVTLNECLLFIAKVNGKQYEIGTFTKQLNLNRAEVQTAIKALEQLLLIRPVRPWSPHNGTIVSVTKHAKIYIRDTGLIGSLLELEDLPMLLDSRHLGTLWEGFVIESLIGTAISTGKYKKCSFYRTHEGDSELDFILEFRGRRLWGIEIKYTEPERVSAGNIRAAKAVGVTRRLVIHNGTRSYSLNGGFEAMPLHKALDQILGND